MKTLGISFGAMCPSIEKQLKEQGLSTEPKDREIVQSCADAIVLLSVHSILSDGERDKARKRMMTLIKKTLKTVKL